MFLQACLEPYILMYYLPYIIDQCQNQLHIVCLTPVFCETKVFLALCDFISLKFVVGVFLSFTCRRYNFPTFHNCPTTQGTQR